jgi:hypothetical protein
MQYLRSGLCVCRPPSRPPTPGPLMCLPMPLCATPAEVPSKILRLRRAWQCAMVVVVDVSWRRAADVTTHLHQQLFPSPAAPEDRCLSAPMRNGTLSEGGLATACVTVTRGLLGVSLPAAPLPRCYSPAHIRPPACLSMSLCASPLRSLRILRLRRANGTWWPMWCQWMWACCHAAAVTPLAAPYDPATLPTPTRVVPSGGPCTSLSTCVCLRALWIAVILIGHGHHQTSQEPALCLGPHVPIARASRLTDPLTAPATAAI